MDTEQKGDLKVKVLFTSIVVMTALAGCSATMPNIADMTKTDTSVQKLKK
ncbi:hypothetical protein TUM17382_10540 [Shewanella algae]|nr:hypothetical protein TUM17382_10540 [Shewanella algae]